MSDHSHPASSDQALLRAFTQQHSEDAFRTLVHRYLPLVYAAAAPWVSRQPHLKEDAAQQVFISLARKARGLPREVPLAAWLHRHAVFTAAKLARGEERRVSRESQATVETPTMHAEAITLSRRQAGQFLLAKLAEKDRAFVIARFFDQQSFQAIGAAYGVSEAAAQKRVERAVERLRKRLNAVGIVSTAALIEQLLGRRDLVPYASESMVAKAVLSEVVLAPSLAWFSCLTPRITVAAVIAFTAIGGVTWLWIAREEPASDAVSARPLTPPRSLLGDRGAHDFVNVNKERALVETEAIVREIVQRALEHATAHYKRALAPFQDRRVEATEATSDNERETARREGVALATHAKGLEWKIQAMRQRWESLLIELHVNKPVGASRHRFPTLVPPSNNDLRIVLERTIRLRSQGNVEGAEEVLTTFEAAHPDHPWLQGLLACWERENGRLDQAVEILDRALETESDHSLDLVQLRATLAFENGDYFQASRDYHEVLSQAGETSLGLWMDIMSRLLEDSPEAELVYRRPRDSKATLDELMLSEAALAQSDEDTELATIWVNGAVQLNSSAVESAGMARLQTLGWRHQP